MEVFHANIQSFGWFLSKAVSSLRGAPLAVGLEQERYILMGCLEYLGKEDCVAISRLPEPSTEINCRLKPSIHLLHKVQKRHT